MTAKSPIPLTQAYFYKLHEEMQLFQKGLGIVDG